MTELNLNFLWNCSQVLPNENHTHKLLKSYYVNTMKENPEEELELSEKRFGESSMCPKCSLPWIDNNFILSYSPGKIKSSKAKRLVASLNSGQKLKKKEKKRAKWYKKKMHNRIILNCSFCEKITKIPLQQSKPHCEELAKTFKLTKGKRPGGVKSISSSSSNLKSVDKKSNKKPPKGKIPTLSNASVNIKKPNKKQPQSRNNKKKKQFANVSKTQEKNTLLHLANVLKKGKSSTDSSKQDKFKSLLRPS